MQLLEAEDELPCLMIVLAVARNGVSLSYARALMLKLLVNHQHDKIKLGELEDRV